MSYASFKTTTMYDSFMPQMSRSDSEYLLSMNIAGLARIFGLSTTGGASRVKVFLALE